jgi:hypothetical protein
VTVRTRWVSSIDELLALGPPYDRMVLASGDGGLFYQREWLARVWPYYEASLGGTLSFLIAEQGSELVALAPLVSRTKSWTHARQRVLGFIGGTWDELDNWMPGFRFGTQDQREQLSIVEAFAAAIARRRWDLLDLRLMRTSPSHEALRLLFPGLRATPAALPTPRARLDDGWAPYWASRSHRLTRMVERGRKRAAADGANLVHEVTTEIPLARRAEVESLHRARQERLRTSGRVRNSPFEGPLASRTFWSLIDWAASQGQLRAHWLRISGGTAAYVIALHHAKTTFAYFNAIDPSAERYHPGSLVLAGLIEREAVDYGTVVVDLMLGVNMTKTLFATEHLTHTNVSVVNPDQASARAKDVWLRTARLLLPGRRN